MFATVNRTFYFDAAHLVPCFGQGHKCGRLHGHTWRVTITIAGKVHEVDGIVVDYYNIDKVWKDEIYDVIDHTYLNEIPGLEMPTTEHIAAWMWRRLIGPLTSPEKTYQMSKITIQEGQSDACEFFGAL